MALLSGKQIGEFEVQSVIGTGGFSTVYLAVSALGQQVAVKVLAENHAFDPDIRERFISEADALRRVRSDLIVDVYDLGETSDGQPYIVIQYADRGDLVHRRRTLINNGWKPLAVDVQFLADVITDALAAVHAEDLVHRDVSPSNILIFSGNMNLDRSGVPFMRGDESLLLADFGLVKDMSQGSGLTVGAGTPGFSAPEQRTGLALIDHRIDIYAASAVILWFLTGATVTTLPDWRDRLADQDLPIPLLNSIGKGLSTLPEDRHQSIDEWHIDITENLMFLADAEGQGIVSSDELPPISAPRGSSASRSVFSALDKLMTQPKILGAIALAIVLLTMGVLGRDALNETFNPESEAVEQSAEDEASPTNEPTDTTTSTTAVSTSATLEQLDEEIDGQNIRPPELADAYFAFVDNQQALLTLWSDNKPPEGVLGREVQISVNGGEFRTELRESTVTELGQRFFRTGNPPTPISKSNDYRVRIRWMAENDVTSDWAPVRVIRAEE